MKLLDLIELNKDKLMKDEALKMICFFQEYLNSVDKPNGFKYITVEDFEAIEALSDKIIHMTCNIGCPCSVRPMLHSIVSLKIKRWLKFSNYYNNYERGRQLRTKDCIRKWTKTWGANYQKDNMILKGHFRWNHRAYTLSRRATDLLEKYLNEFG